MEEEQWKVVEGYSRYEISNMGNLRSWVVGSRKGRRLIPRLLKTVNHPFGYKMSYLSSDHGKRKQFTIHQLVLITWVGLQPKGTICTHLNGNPKDNRLINLAWRTHKDNTGDALAHGTIKVGKECSWSKLTDKDVIAIFCSSESHVKLAKIYNVSKSSVYLIKKGKNWKQLTRELIDLAPK